MRMRQVVGGVWGVLIQVVEVGKWAFLAISDLGELEKLKHCQQMLIATTSLGQDPYF